MRRLSQPLAVADQAACIAASFAQALLSRAAGIRTFLSSTKPRLMLRINPDELLIGMRDTSPRKGCGRRLAVALAACVLTWSSAKAVSIDQWTDRAMDFVAKFEGSDFGAITTDTDCQGLSLGKRQHTIKGNSVKNVFDEIISLIGRPGLEKIVSETMGDKAGDFILLIDEFDHWPGRANGAGALLAGSQTRGPLD